MEHRAPRSSQTRNIIRQRSTGRYYQAGVWVDDPASAQLFETTWAAFTFARQAGLEVVDVVSQLEAQPGPYDIVIPVPGARPVST